MRCLNASSLISPSAPLSQHFFILPVSSLPRKRNPSRTAMVALGISNLCFMLPWQFAQFVLLTQVKRKAGETEGENVGRLEKRQRD